MTESFSDRLSELARRCEVAQYEGDDAWRAFDLLHELCQLITELVPSPAHVVPTSAGPMVVVTTSGPVVEDNWLEPVPDHMDALERSMARKRAEREARAKARRQRP